MNKKRSRKFSKGKWEKVVTAIALATIVLAWIVGYLSNKDEIPSCRSVIPKAESCEKVNGDIYEGIIRHEDGTETVLGWAAVAQAPGYAGPVKVFVGINPAGEVMGLRLLSHTETPVYVERIKEEDFFQEFMGHSVKSPFRLGEDIEGVTRATLTSRAITGAVRGASEKIAGTQLGLQVERERKKVKFGVPELTIIGLYIVGYFGHRRTFKHKKIARWGSMLVGMGVLGFLYNLPFTLSHFNSLLLGYLPNWRENMYWFILVGGIFFVVTVDNKNPYCQWFCPFGATQECLGAIGGANVWNPSRKPHEFLKWGQRLLAWSAIVLGLLFRNPSLASYEVFGTLFAFQGEGVQWVVLVVVILLSLFVRRPWCNYLCPIKPIIDVIRAVRRWTRNTVNIWRKRILDSIKL